MIQQFEDATGPASPEPPQPTLEQIRFRGDMATEMFVKYPHKTAWVITKENLQHYAQQVSIDPKVASRMFNGICAELSFRRNLTHLSKGDYLICGALVTRPADGVQRPTEEYGLLVDTISQLKSEFDSSPEPIEGYGPRSQELLGQFVTELFTPPEQ